MSKSSENQRAKTDASALKASSAARSSSSATETGANEPETALTQLEEAQDSELDVAAPERDKTRRTRKRDHLKHVILGLFSLLFLLALIAGFMVLAFTDREIIVPKSLTAKIEEHINRNMGAAGLTVGQLVVVVDEQFIPRISARHVGLLDENGAEVMRVNALRATLSLDHLKQRQFTPDTLYVSGAQMVARRKADGRFSMSFGGGSGEVASANDIPRLIDETFSEGAFATVQTIEARDVTIALEDVRTQRIWQATDVAVVLSNLQQKIDVSFDFEIFNGTEDLAKIQARFSTEKDNLTSTISLNVEQVPASDMAQQSPALSFLSVLDAPISGAMRAQINEMSQLTDFSGTLEIGAGTLAPGQGARPLAFAGAKGYFSYDPQRERLSFPELTLHTDVLEVDGSGHVLLQEFDGNWPNKFVGQFDLSHLAVDAPNVMPEQVLFDAGRLDLQLGLNPFKVDIGQFSLRQDVLWVRSSGSASAQPEGWRLALDSQIDTLSVTDLMRLWPAQKLAKSRAWIEKNITSGQFHDVGLSLRLAPENALPSLYLDWHFDGANVNYIKGMPQVSDASGYGSIHENELLVVVEGGHVTAPSGGDIDVANSVVRIPDLSERPGKLVLDLSTKSSVEASLALLAKKPFDILKSASFGPDVASGHATLRGDVSFALKEKITLPDVDFAFSGLLQDVVSKELMPNQTLSASAMDLSVTPDGITLSGPVTVDEAQVNALWSKRFGVEHKGQSDISGQVTLNQSLLDAFDVGLPKGTISGSAQGTLDVALRAGAAPSFKITSNMEGLGLSVPALGFSKAKSRAGTFSIAGRAGDQPEITALSVVAPGLSATQGRVTLTPNGSLERLAFGELKVGNWLNSSVNLLGQGKNAPVKVRLGGGTLDLTRAPFGTGGAGSGGSNQSSSGPLELVLDRLKITDSMSLHGVSATLSQKGGLSGTFKGRLNGAAPITGTLTPGRFGPRIDVKAQNAGQTIMAAGLLEEASGGELEFALVPRNTSGSYEGTARIKQLKVLSAPELAELLSLVSVVGLLEQLSGPGILFNDVRSDFTIHPDRIDIGPSSAEGPSLGITANGQYNTAAKTIDLEGVISPIYFLNGIGQIVSKKGEGLFGFNFDLTGAVDDPKVIVNPLSILTPGALRGIFRSKTPKTAGAADTEKTEASQ